MAPCRNAAEQNLPGDAAMARVHCFQGALLRGCRRAAHCRAQPTVMRPAPGHALARAGRCVRAMASTTHEQRVHLRDLQQCKRTLAIVLLIDQRELCRQFAIPPVVGYQLLRPRDLSARAVQLSLVSFAASPSFIVLALAGTRVAAFTHRCVSAALCARQMRQTARLRCWRALDSCEHLILAST